MIEDVAKRKMDSEILRTTEHGTEEEGLKNQRKVMAGYGSKMAPIGTVSEEIASQRRFVLRTDFR
jgi:hypothetical protein